jgi:hypothetical protein
MENPSDRQKLYPETIIKGDFLKKIGCDPNDLKEVSLLKIAEHECNDQLRKFGAVVNLPLTGLDQRKPSHSKFLWQIQKSYDLADSPSAAQAYSCPALQPSGIL